MSAPEFVAKLRERGVLAGAIGQDGVRLVTHLDVNRNDILKAAEAVEAILTSA